MNSWRASLFSLSNVLIIYLIFTFVHKIISYFGVTVEAKNSARLSFGYFCVPVRHFFLCVMKKNLPAIFSMACISSNYFRSFAESFSPVYFESSLFSMLYVVHITVCVLKDVSILSVSLLFFPRLFVSLRYFPTCSDAISIRQI